MSTIFEHKQGATLSLAGAITPSVGGVLPDFAGWVPAAQIRMPDGGLVETLEASWVEVATGKLKLYKQVTACWPVGVAEIDVRFTNRAGDVLFTTTQPVRIVKHITRV